MSTTERTLYTGILFVVVTLFSPTLDIGVLNFVVIFLGAWGTSSLIRDVIRYSNEEIDSVFSIFLIAMVLYSILVLHAQPVHLDSLSVVPQMDGKPELIVLLSIATAVVAFILRTQINGSNDGSSGNGDSPGADDPGAKSPDGDGGQAPDETGESAPSSDQEPTQDAESYMADDDSDDVDGETANQNIDDNTQGQGGDTDGPE